MSEFWRQFQGRTLNDHYKIISYIGCGAMGGVFHARDQRLRRPVAVKLIDTAQLPPLLADRNRRRFAREAELAASIDSPHVVVVHDFGSDGPLDYLVMELLRGANLKDWLAENPSPPFFLRMELVRQAALGLAAGHALRIVHRDVKPSNLFVTPESGGGVRVKLVDFGIAKPVDARSEEGTITSAGEFIGTPRYASPEQLRGEVDLTPSSDVFSLGILAYMLVTGCHPFTDDDRTRLFNGSPVHVTSPQRHTPDLSHALCALILRALEVSSAHRPQTAGAFADELAAVMQSSTLTATTPPLGDVFGERTVEWPTPVRDSRLQARAGRLPRTPALARWFSTWPNPTVGRGIAAILVVGAGSMGFIVLNSGGMGADPMPVVRVDSAQRQRVAREANEAGLRFLDSRDYDAAVIQFQRAVDLRPDHPEYPDNLGFALRKAGRLRESVALLEWVVKRHPLREEAHYNLSQSYLAIGDTTRTIEHLLHYIPLTDSTRAEAAQKRIRLLQGR